MIFLFLYVLENLFKKMYYKPKKQNVSESPVNYMENSFDLKETRNNLVAKDNKLIQNSRFALSTVENKAILYLISKIHPDDKPGTRYIFNCREFQALLKWRGSGENSYNSIKAMLSRLSSMQWWIDLDEHTEALVKWFNIVHMNKGTGDIEISFHEDMFPFLYELQKHKELDGHFYTTYKLQNITLMKHRYSPRLYELLKSYQYNNHKWTFENGTGSIYDLQRRIADNIIDEKTGASIPVIPDHWKNWAIFKRDVLNPAVKEINKYTDIKVAYEGMKHDIYRNTTRAVRTINFYMVGKTNPEQKLTDTIIDTEYTVIEDSQNYHQMNLEDLFFMEHKKKLEEEAQEIQEQEALKRESEINRSQYPVLTACLNTDFSESQVCALYEAAISGRVAGIVEFAQWELFATDLITYYYSIVESTPEDTRTTPYKRLFDMVRKDYDNITITLQRQYSRFNNPED